MFEAAAGAGVGSEGRHGGPSLRKREGRVTRGGHGVPDPVPDGPMPVTVAQWSGVVLGYL